MTYRKRQQVYLEPLRLFDVRQGRTSSSNTGRLIKRRRVVDTLRHFSLPVFKGEPSNLVIRKFHIAFDVSGWGLFKTSHDSFQFGTRRSE